MILSQSVSKISPQGCIHNWIALQAENLPDAIAVISAENQLTFRELNQQANQLAHHLQALGVQPETLVGIYMNRSLDMIISIMGILKAGGTYVPLDPTYPKERLALILEETQAKVLVTQEHLAEQLPPLQSQIINLDTDWNAIASMSSANPNSEMGSEALAYVMYTSGSTGKPKGVQITHANIHHYIQAMGEELQIQPSDVYLHTASFSFSSSVRQLIVPLSLGATVVLTTVEQLSDPLKLFEFIKTRGATIVDFVPSYWRRCTEILCNLEDERRRNLLDNRLRLALSASEPLLSDIPKIWQTELKPEIRFVNMYGQTETSGIIATYSIPQTNEDKAKVVPIGKPIANTQIFLLNDELVPVTDGETGEIYIGGLTLGKGYLNRPDLTKERFTDDPFSSSPNTRLYKTGDLGRRLPNGAIAFAGRLDYQVKIRGKRVELGEIETSLALHPDVKQTVVVGNEAPSGDVRLIAYIVPEPSLAEVRQVEFVRELRGYLQGKLPDYMVPSFFVRLSAFPLTPNGKIDRKALPSLEETQKGLATTYVPPRNGIELKLTEIWQKVLGVPQVGIQDNFFEVGGNSLLAVSLLNKVETALGTSLPVSIFAEAQTIEELSHYLSESRSSNSQKLLITLQNGNSQKTPIFFAHALWGNTLFYRRFIDYLDLDHPCYGIESIGSSGKHEPATSIGKMVDRYLEEILTVQPQGPYFLCGYSLGGIIVYELAQRLIERGQSIAFLCLIDSVNPDRQKPSPVEGKQSLTLRNSLPFHASNLLKLNISEQLQYIYYRLVWHLTGGKFSVFYKIYLHLRQEPQKLRLIQVAAAHNQAVKKYTPTASPVQLTLFRAQQQDLGLDLDRTLGWSELALDGVAVYEFPGSHDKLMEEPTVRHLAKQFQERLLNAQSNQRL